MYYKINITLKTNTETNAYDMHSVSTRAHQFELLTQPHKYVSILSYEPADLTVHPPPQNDREWVHFFRMGV